ncbi:MAG: hypothetical protein HOP08_19015 [Cyclobacteriaceae bacterium]|nr:hypothetical protein [Cyclobacteriaceae bacterium]
MLKLLFVILLSPVFLFAQEDKKVMEPINRLFEGMKKGDSALAHSAFRPNPSFYTVFVDKTGQPAMKANALGDFLKAIGTPHKDVWNELIWSPKVEIDGNLAQVWVPYGFYVNATFSHCGVDVFNLFKDGTGQWKIFHLADTRQKEACSVPKELTDKLK